MAGMSDRLEAPEDLPNELSDEFFMDQAIAAARIAFAAGDVPVGAVVVLDGEIVARGHNRRQVSGDPTAHAEIEALRAASREVGGWRIEGTLYVTQEPCPMCAGALVNARISRLVYGCANPKAGSVDSLYSIVTDPRLNHRMPVSRGVRGGQCAELLRSFFAGLRARQRDERVAKRTAEQEVKAEQHDAGSIGVTDDFLSTS
jgi:tRNA(adenine34) deaminase